MFIACISIFRTYMTIQEKKEKFIEAWGCLGPKWGITKTMANIHALLLFSNESLCSDEIMEHLEISRGNTCMNMKSLLEWELIKSVPVEGDRKEYYVAEKDMWKIFTKIIKKRKECELVPLQEILQELSVKDENDQSEEAQIFNSKINEMKLFADKADDMLENFINSENSWLLRGLKMMIR